MANIVIMIGGALLNADAFTSGNYLAKYLSGDSGKVTLEEKTRHDKAPALEGYHAAMATYTRDRTKLSFLIGSKPTGKSKTKRSRTLRTPITRSNSDHAQSHPDRQITPRKERQFSDFYQPSELEK